ncbi:MAG: hypothetical protein NTW66_04270 [Candidatus Magasanikbacteria bacterium]|nr:hypothetical protein [Candidatus Magasanikbacteria bacterium]
MFGKKEEKIVSSPEASIKVVTMPHDFYAGANPTVKFKEVEQTIDLNKLAGIKEHEKKALHAATAAQGAANTLSSKRWVWVVGSIVLFLIFAGGAGIYYWWQGRSKIIAQTPVLPPITTPPVNQEPVVPTTPVEPATTTPEPELPVITEAGLEFPSKLLAESVDFDADKVSDVAEELFATDPSNADTDKDGYQDGHELYYLYNPNGAEPKKLIDSGFVRNYISPGFGYELYYPNNWAIGAVDVAGRQMLFSTLTGENIEVRVFDLLPGQTFAEWFALNAPQENLGDYTDMQSRFNANAKMRSDGLVYIFYDSTHVFALLYHTTESNTVNYKVVIQTMARSFKIGEPMPPEMRPVGEPEMIFEAGAPETMSTGSAGSAEGESTTTSTETATTTGEEIPSELMSEAEL